MLLGKEKLQNGSSSCSSSSNNNNTGKLGLFLQCKKIPPFHKLAAYTSPLQTLSFESPQCQNFNKEMWHQRADGPEMWDSHSVNWKSPDLNRFKMRFCLNKRVPKTPGLSRSFVDACLFAVSTGEAGDARTMMHQTGSWLIHSLKITTQTSCHGHTTTTNDNIWKMSLQCPLFVPKTGAG